MSEPAGLAGGFSRFRVDFAYDGTDFNGWAKQPKLRTVQGDLLKVLEQIFGPTENDFAMRVAGRTDAGEHARRREQRRAQGRRRRPLPAAGRCPRSLSDRCILLHGCANKFICYLSLRYD